MTNRRKSIRLSAHEHKLLERLYLRWRIPVDQYESRPDELEGLCEEWRGLCKRTDSNGEILRYMRNRRKNNTPDKPTWVVFDGSHQIAPPLPVFKAEAIEILIGIYGELVAAKGEGSDYIAYDGELAQQIAKALCTIDGRVVPPYQLVAKLTAIRKRGLLPPTQKDINKPLDETGFNDIDEVG